MADKDSRMEYKPAAESNSGEIVWTASEYVDHQRRAGWYLALITVTAVVAAAGYFITRDYFATISIVVVGLIVGSVAHWKPREVRYILSSNGIAANDKIYPYNHFKTFSIIKDGPLNSLVLNPIKRFAPPLSAFFEAEDEQAIVELVGEHLPHEERKPDRIDTISKRLRF